jgi:hypothetical protein
MKQSQGFWIVGQIQEKNGRPGKIWPCVQLVCRAVTPQVKSAGCLSHDASQLDLIGAPASITFLLPFPTADGEQ